MAFTPGLLVILFPVRVAMGLHQGGQGEVPTWPQRDGLFRKSQSSFMIIAHVVLNRPELAGAHWRMRE